MWLKVGSRGKGSWYGSGYAGQVCRRNGWGRVGYLMLYIFNGSIIESRKLHKFNSFTFTGPCGSY